MNEKGIFIIGEAGVNHNGSLDLAYKLCDAAKEAEVDAVKFQTWKTEKLMVQDAALASYQKDKLKNAISQFEMAKNLELSYDDFRDLKAYCEEIDIRFLSTPDEEESLDFLVQLGIDVIKVGSGEITNIQYLRKIGSKRMDVILSTGMSYLDEVGKAYDTLLESGARSISLLHCTTNYPCPEEEVNLRAMITLKETFGVKVGYSDHTMGIEVSIAAAAMGAQIIEKHLTLDTTMDGPDHKASLEPQELKKMVNAVRKIEKALGTGEKAPNRSELDIRKVILKSIVAAKPIGKGEKFTQDNLTTKRGCRGIDAARWDEIINRTAQKDFLPDEIVEV